MMDRVAQLARRDAGSRLERAGAVSIVSATFNCSMFLCQYSRASEARRDRRRARGSGVGRMGGLFTSFVVNVTRARRSTRASRSCSRR